MKRVLLALLAAGTIGACGRPAHAGAPVYQEMPRVERLAERLERGAIRLHNLAEAEARHFNRSETFELNRLRELEAIASNFRDMVERYGDQPYRTEAAFERLMRSYLTARDGLDELQAYEEVDDAFAQVRRVVGELRLYYSDDDGGRSGRDDDRWSDDVHYED